MTIRDLLKYISENPKLTMDSPIKFTGRTSRGDFYVEELDEDTLHIIQPDDGIPRYTPSCMMDNPLPPTELHIGY